MKSLIFSLILTVVMMAASTSSAYLIDSRPQRNGDGSVTQNITILCNQDDGVFCEVICDNSLYCQFPEPLCLDCAGTSSTLLRTIFSRVDTYYEASTEQALLKDLAGVLALPNYILISTKSIYNFYKPWDSEELKKQFATFCPIESEVPLLLVSLDAQNRPDKLVYAFCQLTPEIALDTTLAYPIFPKSNPSSIVDNKTQTPNPLLRKQ